MLTFSQAIDAVNIKHTIIEKPAGLIVQLFEGASSDAIQCVTDLGTSIYGLALDAHGEVASTGTLHFVTKSSPRYLELAAADANVNSEEDDEIFPEDSDDEDEDGEEGEEVEAEDEEETEELEDRDLKVLVGPEHHKMATKLYVGLCNNQNLARFPAFTIDLDHFLQRYYVRPPVGSDFDTSDFGEEASALQEIAADLAVKADDAFFMEVAEFLAEEVAKKKQKNGRAGFLSSLMKLISGDEGDAIINAFDSGDTPKLQELMTGVVGKLKAAKAAE